MDYGNLDRAIAALKQANGLIGQILDKVAVGELLDVSSGDSSVFKSKIKDIRDIVEEIEHNLETSKDKIINIENQVKGG